MKIKPIVYQRISDQVFEQMKQQILQGAWKPGQKLPSENDLAVSFGVSRITVRQAMQKLSVLELVDTRSGEGSYIKEARLFPIMNGIIPIAYLGDNDIRQVLEFRQMVEVETAGFAAEKATLEEIAQLKELYNEMRKIEIEKDRQQFAKLDLDFHFKIAEMTKNELIIATHNILREILSTAMEQIVEHLGSDIGIYYHGKLLEAIEARDVKRTKDIMREHLQKTLESMCSDK
ncbi:FadR/GntR family transcriptional regulator [Caproiciproducens sp. R1]|jgi:Transcriptional regulators|uniref:FadR/GntR family transcriptional regulator n=1 Tax=Caproiciproducens sp. R1 TaxID=3435000 RepID=UPI0005707291